MTTNSCDTNVCNMNKEGNGEIPEDSLRNWAIFIDENCHSIYCDRRYTTRCCKWGKFKSIGTN